MAKIPRSRAFPKPLRHSATINVYNRQKELPLRGLSVRMAASELLLFLKIQCDELSVYFVSEKKISDLHRQFFDDPSPTDCISFPIDGAYLGEIFICPKAAITYGKQKNTNPYQELLLYLIHGILHLIGYDDLGPVDRKAMRKMEKKCMGHLMKQGISLDPIST